MRKSILISICGILLFALPSIAQSDKEADQILGLWLTGSKKGKVKIYKCGDKYCGKIVWLREPYREDGSEKLDRENPDEELQKRKIIGTNILSGFVYDEDLEWEDGEIYDPDNGKTYSCVINYIPEKNLLEVRGYIGFSLLGRTEEWLKTTLD